MFREGLDELRFVVGIEIADVDSAASQERYFVEGGLADSQHNVARTQYLVTILDQLRARILIFGIGKSGLLAEARLDDNVDPEPLQLPDRIRGHGHASFGRECLRWYSNLHEQPRVSLKSFW